MEVRKGYKQTDIGVIPEDWEAIKLGSYVEIKSGESPSLFQFESDGIPYFKVDQLNSTNKYLSETPYNVKSGKKIARGSLIFPKRGASILLNKIRILAEDAFMDTNLMTLTPKEKIFSEFLFYALTHVELWRIADTTSIPQINNKHITPLVIALPPTLAEQEAIAEALSDADAQIESLEALLAKKRHVKQGAMSELLTPPSAAGRAGKRRVVESGEWKPVTMIDLLVQSATYGIVKSGEFQPSGIPMLRGGDIKEGRILTDLPFVTQEKSNEFSRTVLKAGDVVIALVGYPGEAAKVPAELEGANISRAVGLLRPNNKVNPDYLVHYLNSTMGRSMVLAPSAGSAQLVVNLSELNKLQFVMPPLPEQTAIAEILSDMDAEIRALEGKLSKARAVKAGMMSALLGGRIRLVVESGK